MDASLHHQFAGIERRHWWFQGRRKVVASVLRDSLEDGRAYRILDVGCGTGEMTDMLREFGSVTALDTSPDAIRYCNLRFGDQVDVRLGDVSGGVPPLEGVEIVTAFDVLEHLDDDVAALGRLHAALAPRGVLVVTVPAFQFLWGPHDVINEHRRRYTHRALRRRLETAGFDVERISYFNALLFPLVAAVRLLRRLPGRRPLEPRSDFTMPPGPLNRVLEALFSWEGRLLKVCSLPVGVSILAVCRKTA